MYESPENNPNEVRYPGVPDIKVMIKACLLAFFLELLFIIIDKLLFSQSSKSIYQIVDILLTIFIGVVVFLYLQEKNVDFISTFKLKKLSIRILISVLLIIIGMSFMQAGMNPLLHELSSSKIAEQITSQYSPHNPSDWFLFILSTVLLGPLFEELIFRGIMQSSINARYGLGASIVIPALSFGLIHILPVLVLNCTILGMIYGLLVHYTKSIYSSLIPHSLDNLMVGVFQYLLISKPISRVNTVPNYRFILGAIVIGILVLIWGFKRLYNEKNRMKHDNQVCIHPYGAP